MNMINFIQKLGFTFHSKKKPNILMVLDYRGWAFDNSAQAISRELSHKYNFEFLYVNDIPKPEISKNRFDLFYVFFWGEKYHTKFNINNNKVIKEVSSHRWIDDRRFGPCTTEQMVNNFLNDANTIICTSERLVNEMKTFKNKVFHTPNGIDINIFYNENKRSGKLKLGWAGNIDDSVKGFKDIIEPACRNIFKIKTAYGNLNHSEMNSFYNSIDVLIVSSKHEGEPLTLIESMATGCFPVCVNVGIVPELIEDKINGYIVENRTAECFLEAFRWCEKNLDFIRQAGKKNAELIKDKRSWKSTSVFFENVFDEVLNESKIC